MTFVQPSCWDQANVSGLRRMPSLFGEARSVVCLPETVCPYLSGGKLAGMVSKRIGAVLTRPLHSFVHDSGQVGLAHAGVCRLIRGACNGSYVIRKRGFLLIRWFYWRRGWDSNPRGAINPHPISSRRRYGHFGTSPWRHTLSFRAVFGKSLYNLFQPLLAKRSGLTYKRAPSLRSLELMNWRLRTCSRFSPSHKAIGLATKMEE